MSRKLGAVIGSMLAVLILAAAAVAASPISNGVYTDGPHGVTIGLAGRSSIHAFDVQCGRKTWVAFGFIPVNAGGHFSYNGPDVLARNGRLTKTKGTMTLTGRFKTSKLAIGFASAGGCGTNFRAGHTS
jgi:hypothetical protein